jgi:hypothetical protein
LWDGKEPGFVTLDNGDNEVAGPFSNEPTGQLIDIIKLLEDFGGVV